MTTLKQDGIRRSSRITTFAKFAGVVDEIPPDFIMLEYKMFKSEKSTVW